VRASLAPGGLLAGRYRLVRRIGQGSMGVVHEAERVSDGHRVAIKVLRADLAGDAKALHRFKREARLGARIASRHVVPVLDAGADDSTGAAFLVMDLVDGKTLVEHVRERGGLSLTAAGELLEQIYDALCSAHRAGIVHRDLKPENVLIPKGEELRALVSDFGIAKGLDDQSWASTEAGLGTPLWTSPEQAKTGYVPSPRSDVWALGLLTYFVLTGHPYWKHAERGSVIDVVMELQRGDLVAASLRAQEQGAAERLPRGFDAWFARTVVRDPAARFRDAREAWQRLAPLLGRRVKSWRVAALVLGALALAIVAALLLLLR
jgi:serine/threonine protein kinase